MGSVDWGGRMLMLDGEGGASPMALGGGGSSSSSSNGSRPRRMSLLGSPMNITDTVRLLGLRVFLLRTIAVCLTTTTTSLCCYFRYCPRDT